MHAPCRVATESSIVVVVFGKIIDNKIKMIGTMSGSSYKVNFRTLNSL